MVIDGRVVVADEQQIESRGQLRAGQSRPGRPVKAVVVVDHHQARRCPRQDARHLARPEARQVGMIGSGGMARTALEAFVAFRGRKPDVRPLLRQHGIAA